MVKNSGGNKAKKFASKSFNVIQRATRFATEEGEAYAIVNKILGGPLCEVLCIDGIVRNCVIRGKFTGKGKRDNMLTRGKWVLVGLRDWEVTMKDTPKCDLLEVYNDTDKEKLIKNSTDSFRIFLSINNEEDEFDKDQIEFINTRDEELEEEKGEGEGEGEGDGEGDGDGEEKADISSIMKQIDWVDIDDI